MAGKLLVAIAILVGACGLRAQQLGDGERAALERAGEHADRWRPGFAGLAADERAAYTFLLRHMPERDLAGLSPELVRENVQLACDVRRHVAWGAALSDELFWNDVVPYAQANETREAWRPWMVRDWLPLVQDCETPGEAAQVLNRRIFDLIEVHYSTGRRRADQSPSESIEQGKATCTGLSILLADACRACCVPARLVSVRWPHKRGNHTWVEVWDGAAWRFCGADEPDPKGLDRAWFVGDAARCVDADRDHRIWAVSFAATGERFAAGWGRVQLWGVDVTDRYAPKAAVRQVEAPAAAGGDDALLAQLARWFAADDARRATFGFDRNLDEELRTRRGDTRLRALVWQALRAHERPRLQVDHTARVARVGDAACSFTVEQVGERPAGGWPLVIALHGDAEPPRRTPTGDEDAPAPGGYLYCALRASDDLLGGARPGAFDAVVERLIRQFCVCDGVDPERVVAIGRGKAGDAALAVGARLPHRFAAVHASAVAPAEGSLVPEGLHSLPLSLVVGREAAGRGRCEAFAQQLAALRERAPGRYPATFRLVDGLGVDGPPDRERLRQLVPQRRQAAPRHLTWCQRDAGARDHYWLHVERPRVGALVDARVIAGGVLLSDLAEVELWLDARLVDMTQPLQVQAAPMTAEHEPAPSLRTLCATMAARGDPGLAASWVLKIPRAEVR